MHADIITALPSADRVRADQERRRSNAAVRHIDRRARARRGSGKGGRQGARRAACSGW